MTNANKIARAILFASMSVTDGVLLQPQGGGPVFPLKIEEKVGKGSNGQIYRAKYQNERYFSVKVVNGKTYALSQFTNQVAIMHDEEFNNKHQLINVPLFHSDPRGNRVKFEQNDTRLLTNQSITNPELAGLEDDWVKTRSVLVLNWLDGDFAYYLNNFDKPETLTVIRGLLQCVQALHDNGYVHRDIHRGNIMFKKGNDGDTPTFILGDLGAAMKVPAESDSHAERRHNAIVGHAGTSGFHAPERMFPEEYKLDLESRPADIYKFDAWSIGLIIWFFLSRQGSLPWHGYNQDGLKKYMQQMPAKKILAAAKTAPDVVKTLLEGLLQPDAAKRWTIDQALFTVMFGMSAFNWTDFWTLAIYLLSRGELGDLVKGDHQSCNFGCNRNNIHLFAELQKRPPMEPQKIGESLQMFLDQASGESRKDNFGIFFPHAEALINKLSEPNASASCGLKYIWDNHLTLSVIQGEHVLPWLEKWQDGFGRQVNLMIEPGADTVSCKLRNKEESPTFTLVHSHKKKDCTLNRQVSGISIASEALRDRIFAEQFPCESKKFFSFLRDSFDSIFFSHGGFVFLNNDLQSVESNSADGEDFKFYLGLLKTLAGRQVMRGRVVQREIFGKEELAPFVETPVSPHQLKVWLAESSSSINPGQNLGVLEFSADDPGLCYKSDVVLAKDSETNRPLGFVVYEIHRGERQATIRYLGTDPQARGQGVAACFMKGLEHFLIKNNKSSREIPVKSIVSTADYSGSQKLLPAMGYKKMEEKADGKVDIYKKELLPSQ